ncbi:Lipin/Ned1/Smp2-domain-containing protein [Leucosporidium creatinivorum]|uniref:phosphatidate phosphatase n=1 Tax=Leucosporidium creatinivorum TaxID=106004 RepID=A0A1Y2G0W0_9BASI|nr:Lipin/Ned1/Smp2-domain-containing protein [Leucosporidium creatinivorum]
MQYLKSAVQYYKDINPATLTGAIDVIVVERPSESGVEGEVELACSPFHVRFGKLSVLRPIDKKVRITVNDDEIPFYMKVGETGEAFFVFETDGNVPEDLQTSPLSSPVSNEKADEEAPGEPDFLDLGASQTAEGLAGEGLPTSALTDDSSPASSRYASVSSTQVNSPIQRRRSLPPAPGLTASTPLENPAAEEETQEDESMDTTSNTARLKSAMFVPAVVSSAVEKVAGLGGAAMQGVSKHGFRDQELKKAVKESSGEKVPTREHDNEEHAVKGEEGLRGQSTVEDTQELGQLEKGMREKLEGLELEDRPEPGDEVRKAARKRNEDVRSVLGGTDGIGKATSYDGTETDSRFSLKPSPTGLQQSVEEPVFKDLPIPDYPQTPSLEQTGDLMLDMSGYKIDAADDEKDGESTSRANRDSQDYILDAGAEEEVIAFTQGLLQSTDPKTLRNFFDPSDERSPTPSRAASPEPFEEEDAPLRPLPTPLHTRSRGHSRASSPPRPLSISSLQSLHAEAELEPSPTDGVFHASPKQFTLKIGGKVHVFELSLCDSDDFGRDRAKDDVAFAEHQVTFSQFMEQDAVTDHNDLVVKYGDRYLTWDNASPVLASLAVYRKSLVDHPEHHQRRVDDVDAKRPGRGWGSWFSRKGTPNAEEASTVSLPATDTSPPTSPPVSPPESPRSLPQLDTARPDSPAPEDPSDAPEQDQKHYAKTLRLTSDQLKLLNLKKGMNAISFSVRSSYSGFATCTSRVFLWESDFSVVISDIDGTITKSDALGHVFTMIGRDWTHLGVAKLYTDIARNGYKMMYLTSRAIGQADTTREYLKGITQNGFKLPEGPVIMSPDRLMASFHREVVLRKPEVFKMACLRDIQRLFHERSPFYAGFGNRITDALSYRSVDVPSSRIFTIDTNGEVKMELLELAGYKSSYIHMTDLVDQMFPPINRKTAPDFTDFNFWRAPVPQFDIPDLSPPSPALSARSDSSRLAFPRLGSIASSLSRRSSKQTLADGATSPGAPGRSSRAGTPSSPLLQATVVEEPSELDDDDDDGRSESESMPGSLPNDNDFERLRAAAMARNRGATEAEEYKMKMKREVGIDGEEEEDEEEEEEEEEEEDEGDELDQMDFSSVPYL